MKEISDRVKKRKREWGEGRREERGKERGEKEIEKEGQIEERRMGLSKDKDRVKNEQRERKQYYELK